MTPLGPPLSVQEASLLLVGMAMHTWAAKDNEAVFSDLSVAESNLTKATDKHLHYQVDFVQLRYLVGL